MTVTSNYLLDIAYSGALQYESVLLELNPEGHHITELVTRIQLS